MPAPESKKSEPSKPIALTPRQAASAGDRGAAATAPAAPANPAAINEQIMSALAQVLTGQGVAPAAPARDDRGLISREDKRFRRAGSASRTDEPVEKRDAPVEQPCPPSGETPAAGAPEIEASEPSFAAAAEECAVGEPLQPSLRRTRGDRSDPMAIRPPAPSLGMVWRRLPGWQRAGILSLLGALLTFLGFVLGRSNAPALPKPESGPPRASGDSTSARRASRLAEANEIKLIDDAMVAQTGGDFGKAETLLKQLLNQAPDVAGAQTALALLSIQKGDFLTAEFHLKAGLDAGEEPGRLYALRGMLHARLNRPRRANEAFELATRSAPHQFKNYFLWAEFLRRIGNNQEALIRLDQAIARVHEQADEEAMQFKRRLTLIAMGRGNELEAEIQRQLAQNPPSGDWLLVALAYEAQKGDYTAAAAHLDRASRTISQDALIDRLRDFYFYQWCYEKELEPYFRPLQKRLTVYRQAEPPVDTTKENDDRPAAPAKP